MRTKLLPRTLLIASTFASLGTTLLLPNTASAQIVYGQAEGGLNVFLEAPQARRYDAGFYASGRVGVWATPYLGLHLQGGYANWSAASSALNANGTALSPGTLATIGLGVRVSPDLGRTLGRLFLDVDAGYGVTGSARDGRLVFDLGVGWLIPIADPVAIGPVLRFNQVNGTQSDASDARFFTAGVAIAFPGRRAVDLPPAPVGDVDHDGVRDDVDQCPSVPADNHRDPTRPGCPGSDRDHDGIYDDEDLCPNAPAGDPARRGCPAPAAPPPAPVPCAPPPAPALPAIENGRIQINDSIYFDTGLATIQSRSFLILDAVAAVLGSHPEVLALRVEGHTDDVGDPRRNLALSRDRAASVLEYLTSHGVAPSRVSSAGFGDTRPIAQGDDEAARARNRRVEFVITSGPGALPVVPEPGARGHGRHHRHH